MTSFARLRTAPNRGPPVRLRGGGLSFADMAIDGPRAVWRFIARSGKRVGVTIGGLVLVIAGVIMLVTPGPGILVVVLGLALLATEYAWAERALDKIRERSKVALARARRSLRRRPRAE